MKIGVVSDTHSLDIPRQLLESLKDMDFIIHAGDFCTVKDLKVFQNINKVKAVFGNMDDMDVRKQFPEEQIIKCDGIAIGLTHGEGSAKNVINCVKKRFEKRKVDAIVFGHSHSPLNKIIDDVLFFNPGSPNDTVFAPFCSYGILEIRNGKIKGSIIKIGDKNG